MRSVVITRHGPPEVLQVQERPDPAPGWDEVLIDVRASGINFADLMARLGLYPDAPKPPCVIGYEVAGTVAAVGDGVEGLAIGDRVAAPVRFGGYAERVTTAAAGVFGLPDAIGFEEGAAIPVNYATAWEAIVRAGNVQPGERVLIHSAGGGVGIAATQLAKRAGAEVWGTASAGKHEAIRGFGVDHPIDYRAAGWQRQVPKLDLVMDAIGGASFRRSYKLLRAGGRLVCFGASGLVAGGERNLVTVARTAVQMPWFNIIRQMSASKSVIGLNVLSLWDEHGSERWAQPLTELIENGTVRPVVAQSFPFDQAGEAHRFIAERRNTGKVVLTPLTANPAIDRVGRFMSSLHCEVREVAPGEWGLTLDAAGFALDVGVSIRGPFLRAQAAVLPAGLIDPHQLLYWNRQAPLVCFAENRAGEVFVCGELPLESLHTETLDRFLGLLLSSAARAREVAIQSA